MFLRSIVNPDKMNKKNDSSCEQFLFLVWNKYKFLSNMELVVYFVWKFLCYLRCLSHTLSKKQNSMKTKLTTNSKTTTLKNCFFLIHKSRVSTRAQWAKKYVIHMIVWIFMFQFLLCAFLLLHEKFQYIYACRVYVSHCVRKR